MRNIVLQNDVKILNLLFTLFFRTYLLLRNLNTKALGIYQNLQPLYYSSRYLASTSRFLTKTAKNDQQRNAFIVYSLNFRLQISPSPKYFWQLDQLSESFREELSEGAFAYYSQILFLFPTTSFLCSVLRLLSQLWTYLGDKPLCFL